MNRCDSRGVKSLLATTLPSGGGHGPVGHESQACKSASIAMAFSKILGSGLCCTWSLLLNFGLSLGVYAKPMAVPDLAVLWNRCKHQHARSDTHTLWSQRSKQL